MSCEQFVFIHRDKVPSRGAWQAAIEANGFDFVIGPELTPFESEGFVPCTLSGQDAGVEILYFEVAPKAQSPKNNLAAMLVHFFRSLVGQGWKNTIEHNQAANEKLFAKLAQGRDYCISFRWSSSEIECASAMILSYALAHNFDAVVSYEGEEPEPLDQLLQSTHGCIEDANRS